MPWGIPDIEYAPAPLNLPEISGMAAHGSIPNGSINIAGGRLGYNFPVANGNLNVGVNGHYVTGNAGDYRFREAGIGGGNVTYSDGRNTFGASYNKTIPRDINPIAGGPVNQQMDQAMANPEIIRNLIQLFYRREF
jgi:hypothetical protein